MKKTVGSLLLAASLALAAPSVWAGRTAPLENIPSQPVLRLDGKPLGLAAVRKVIIAGATSKGWQVQPVNGHAIQATLDVRRHKAVVLISYSAKDYSIKYKNSAELNYVSADTVLADNDAVKEIMEKREADKTVLVSGELIHPNYNAWVKELSQAIATAASNLNQLKAAAK
jgi:hypothetical protein